MKVAFYTLGCKVNQYEAQVLAELFAARGHQVVPASQPADLYVVNSCTVTAAGDQKTRRMLRHLKAQSPGAKVVLTGCYPQAFPQAAGQLAEADLVTGARDRAKLVELAEQCVAGGERLVCLPPHQRGEGFEPMRVHAFSERTRAFVKIQDGCENYCSYCIIPTARGPLRSKAPEDLRRELEGLAAAGYREAVLVGINLSCYGRELGLRLADAVELACGVPGLERVRLGSVEPELLTPQDIARMAAQPKLCGQFHLSLQAGCDATLRRMNRHYDTAEYARIVAAMREQFPGCAITTDVMVGFPGEDEGEFAQSLAFVEKMAFAKVHVFPYSRRPGTRAAVMPGQVPRAEKHRRSARMIALAAQGRAAFLQRQVGLVEPVLFESRLADGLWEGYTANYTPVRAAGAENLQGRLLPVRVTTAGDDWCLGELL